MKTVLALVLLSGVAAADDGATEKSHVDVAPSGHNFNQLTIDNPLGDIRVEGYDGNAIRIETRKHAPDEDTLDRLRVSLVPDTDGSVHITATAESGHEVKPVKRGAVRIDLIIRAPHDAHVEATAASGKVELVNMDNGGELDTASGPISVHNVSGQVFTHSVSGPTVLESVFGSVDAQSINSDVDLDSINGDKLVATVDSGHIAGRRVRARDVELTANHGKISLEIEASLHGHIRVASTHGDVDVKLHRHGAILVRAAGVKVDLGSQQATTHNDGWREFSLGAGDDAAALEMRSRYGNVVFAIVD